MKTLKRRQFLNLAASALALPAIIRSARADTYPSRPIHLIVGFPPGGTADILARLTGSMIQERLGQPIVVENRGAAGNSIAAETVARATPDGYMLLFIANPNVINAMLNPVADFDFVRDIAPIGGVDRNPQVLVVHPSVPVNSVPELIAYAKAHPGELNMASGGIGSTPHLAGELFKMMTGVNMLHVPYRGDAPAITDLLEGQVQVMFDQVILSIDHIRAGRLKALAVSSSDKLAVLPDLPPVSQFVPGYEAFAWQGVGAPKGTPPEIINRIASEIKTALADSKMQKRLADLGGVPMPMSPDEFGQLITNETTKWEQVIKFANIKAG
ncbi:MAG TPA: tripartite tricarboxylate transporter substrate binding protein [Xanthobacteraceae bacterium]|nr:tripartite tricarboxylate transporter substrate binding protein [Xanthobacteraceae bacterium]